MQAGERDSYQLEKRCFHNGRPAGLGSGHGGAPARRGREAEGRGLDGPEHHAAARGRGAAAPVAEDRRDRPAHRGHRARLQQPSPRDARLHRARAGGGRRRRPGGRVPAPGRVMRAARRHADRAAARVRPAPGPPPAAARAERARLRDRRDAALRPRRADRARDRARPRARRGPGRWRPDAAGAPQPRPERARRDARRRHADDPDEQRRASARASPAAASSNPDGTSSSPSRTRAAG